MSHLNNVFCIVCDVIGLCLQALTGPPSQDSIEDTSGHSYDYLLSMPIQNLTVEKVCIFLHALLSFLHLTQEVSM